MSFPRECELVQQDDGSVQITQWNIDSHEQPTTEQLENLGDAAVTQMTANRVSSTRRTSYPTIGDQLDMLWHAIDTGDWTAAKVKTTDFYTQLKAVKDANPKS